MYGAMIESFVHHLLLNEYLPSFTLLPWEKQPVDKQPFLSLVGLQVQYAEMQKKYTDNSKA